MSQTKSLQQQTFHCNSK